jgi:hypothetical protein
MGFIERLFKSRPAADHPACLVCNSAELEWLATEVYRCRACGHEGGDGLPAHRKAETVRKILALSAEERRALAERTLVQALDILRGIRLPSFDGDPLRPGVQEVLEPGHTALLSNKAEVWDQPMMNAVRELAEAERLLADCGEALGRGDVLGHSITIVAADELDDQEELARYRAGLLEIHASLAAELGSN